MIVTGPLSGQAWKSIGWDGFETIGDEAHAYMYAQRTPDGRIALGGRGVPYRFGSGLDRDGAVAPSTVAQLGRILRRMFPAAVGAGIEHAWCGVLGVPRDWCATVTLDPGTGLGWAGGYTGQGVAAANLAGRTLADLVRGISSPLTRLPWVGHRSPRWAPEPARWAGVRGLYTLYRTADRLETARGSERTSARRRGASPRKPGCRPRVRARVQAKGCGPGCRQGVRAREDTGAMRRPRARPRMPPAVLA